MKHALIFATLAAATLASGCRHRQENDEPLTLGEAQRALQETSTSSQAGNLMSATIELSTDFTIGGGIEAAVAEIRSYIESQLPCAEITLGSGTLQVEYGAKPGNCTYRGHSYSGMHSVTVTANGEGQVIVQHDWDQLSNDVVMLSGFATVTWDAVDAHRRVNHELTWTRVSDGKAGIGRGDRTQRPLEGNSLVGMTVDGERAWSGEAGTWELDIDGIEVRWADPVPQAGRYTLVTPSDKEIELSFERLDEDTIVVELSGTKNSFSFLVSSSGAIESAGESSE